MYKKKIIIPFIVLTFLGLMLVACDDDSTGIGRSVNNTDFVASEFFEYAVEVDQHFGLDLDAINGTVNITGVPNADSVIVSGEKKVGSESLEDAQANLLFLEVNVVDQISTVIVSTEQPANTYGRSFVVDYTILVPDSFYATVNAVNGIISIENINNNLSIHNANGQIILNEIAGGVVATLANGQIGGDITLPPNGLIRLTGANGEINLNIPDNTSADFSASVANGVIYISNLFLHDEQRTSNLVTGTLGDGEGNIILSVSNGSINVTGY